LKSLNGRSANHFVSKWFHSKDNDSTLPDFAYNRTGRLPVPDKALRKQIQLKSNELKLKLE
jgi:hypothetical protein